MYESNELAVLQELLAERFLASNFQERFVNAPGKDRSVAHKVLTFSVPKDSVSDFPYPLDIAAGRLILDFAQPEACNKLLSPQIRRIPLGLEQ